MKKMLIFSLVLGFAAEVFAHQHEAVVNGVTWYYNGNKSARITNNGNLDWTQSGTSYSGSLTIPSELDGLPVTKIEEWAFDNCKSLRSITIPNSVTEIGDSAFSGCKALTSITIPNSVMEIGWNAFSGCKALTSITIPNSVTRIRNVAFVGCSSLTSITIPNSVTEIVSNAFDGCESLQTVYVDKGDAVRVREMMKGKGVEVDDIDFVELSEKPQVVDFAADESHMIANIGSKVMEACKNIDRSESAGGVVLSAKINAAGRLSDCRIDLSSGDGDYDNAVLSAAKAIGAIDSLSREFVEKYKESRLILILR